MQMDWARGYHSSHHVSQQMVGLLTERVKLNYIHCYNFHTILRNTLCNSGYRTLIEIFWRIPTTLRSQIEGYTRLLIFRKFYILPAVIWVSLFLNIQINFSLFVFSPKYTNEIFFILPAVIRAYPLIKFGQKFQSTLLLEPPLVLET